MKCNGCGTAMVLDHTEAGAHARADWYRCPLCSKVRLTSHLDGRWNGQHLRSEVREWSDADMPLEGWTVTGRGVS